MEGCSVELMAAVWLAAAVVVGVVAAARNRSGFGWLVISLVITPALAGALLALLPRGDQGQRAPTADTHRQCPACREIVRRDATRCRHRGSTLAPITRAPG